MEESEETYGEKLYGTLRGIAEAQGLLRKPGEQPTRDNKVKTEKWAAALPKAYRLKAEGLEASKDCIYYLKHGEHKEADGCLTATAIAMIQMWILSEEVPTGLIEEQLNDLGQEVAETIIVYLLYPALAGNMEKAIENLKRLPMPCNSENEWGVHLTVQHWLAGLLDAITELAKMMQDILIEDSSIDHEAMFMRMRMVALAIYDLLEKFEAQNTRMLNNSHRRGQGFKEKLQRVRTFIAERIDRVIIDIRIRKK